MMKGVRERERERSTLALIQGREKTLVGFVLSKREKKVADFGERKE